jgi:uncharacterized membrane protein (DUF4010 family)
MPASFDYGVLGNLAVAFLGGLAVGIERERSGHALGPRARFAGVRTFTLLGLISGLSGWLWVAGLQGPAIVFLAGTGALVVAAYFAASRRDVDGTTEVAAFVVMAAALLAGAGYRAVASGIIAVTVLLLVEKTRLHRLVSKLDRDDMRAAARFAVMAAVILPLLPTGPFGPFGGIRPRMLWSLVLFFSGLSFVGYLARRTLGPHRGYALAGLLAGILSSTSATLTLARQSQQASAAGRALASGAIGASTVLFPRVLIACAVLSPALARAVWPAFIAPVLAGAFFVFRGWRDTSGPARITRERNPLQFGAALQMAALFQGVLFAVFLAKSWFGEQGLYGSGALLGLVDVDGLTLSLAQAVQAGTAADVGARALTLGILVNTLFKMMLALTIGRGRFRVLTAIGLAVMAGGLGAWVFYST